MDINKFFENSTSLTLHRGSENLKIPIIGSKIKVVADLSSDLSKQARERHWDSGEKISSIGLTSLKKTPKCHFSGKLYFWVVFGIFLLTGKEINFAIAESILQLLVLRPHPTGYLKDGFLFLVIIRGRHKSYDSPALACSPTILEQGREEENAEAYVLFSTLNIYVV